MANLTITQLYALARKAGFGVGGAVNAAAIAMAESGGDPNATSPNPDGGTNVGLMQLDTPNGKGAGYSVAQLKDPLTNMQVARQASNNGYDWSAWQTYVDGTYKRYFDGAQKAADQETGSGLSIDQLLGGIGDVIASPIKGIEEVGAVVKAFYETITDGKMWRSLGWIILGAIVLFLGVRLWYGSSIRQAAINAPGIPGRIIRAA